VPPPIGYDIKPTITLDTGEYPGLPDLAIDDEGSLILKFKVVGVNKHDDESGFESTSFTLEYEIDDIKMRQISLSEATRRAGEGKSVYVKTQSNPSPG